MVFLFKVEEILKNQIIEVELWHNSSLRKKLSESSDFLKLVSKQHHVNFDLWHQEDMARDPFSTDSKIASVKRTIDLLNQERNDLIEEMDRFLINIINKNDVKRMKKSEMNSETPGNIIDRLSINALKIYHMDEETKRDEVDLSHRKNCEYKLSILREQRHDLGICLDKLLNDLKIGKKFPFDLG